MRKNRGISMITLVITIVVMIILLGLAYRVGTRYISTSKTEEQNALASIVSNAVSRRQNDNYSGLLGENAYYSGYHVSSGDFERIASLVDSSDSFDYGNGLWYILDAKKAADLGIKDSNKYLVDDLENDSSDGEQYLILADYYTGKVYIIYYDKTVIDINTLGRGSDGHQHEFTIVSCTEPQVCVICGEIASGALGHFYGYGPAEEGHPNGRYYPKEMSAPTCTLDLKCERCGYIAQKATGHLYDTSSLESNEEGHFHVCRNIDPNSETICGAMGDFEKHTKQYIVISTPGVWQHTVYCPICNYSGTEDCDTKIKTKDTYVHTKYCSLCLKEEDVAHDVIKYRYVDKNTHIVYCDTCKADIREEEHVDLEEPYGICDRCNGTMDITKKPQIISVLMENTTPTGENKYWAKKGDTITITIVTDTFLSGAPTIKVQGITILENDIKNPETMKYVATFKTSQYAFHDGQMNLEISNVKSLWGVYGDSTSATSDGNYVTYDGTLPQYYYYTE